MPPMHGSNGERIIQQLPRLPQRGVQSAVPDAAGRRRLLEV